LAQLDPKSILTSSYRPNDRTIMTRSKCGAFLTNTKISIYLQNLIWKSYYRVGSHFLWTTVHASSHHCHYRFIYNFRSIYI